MPQPATIPDDIAEPLAQLLRLWTTISADHRPTEADFPFDSLVSDNPGLALIDIVERPMGKMDFRYRRVGPAHSANTGWNIEGRFVSEVVHPHIFRRTVVTYQRIQKTATPHYWQMINVLHGAPPVAYERVILPLFDNNASVSKLLGLWEWREHKSV